MKLYVPSQLGFNESFQRKKKHLGTVQKFSLHNFLSTSSDSTHDGIHSEKIHLLSFLTELISINPKNRDN